MDLTAATVGSLLQSAGTREATFGALESVDGPHDRQLALSTAAALGSLGDQLDEPAIRRAGLLLARVTAQAEEPASMYGALLRGEGRMERWHGGMARLLAVPASELNRDSAITYACFVAPMAEASTRGWTCVFRAVGFEGYAEFDAAMCASHPLWRDRTDGVPLRLAILLHELLREDDPEELRGGWAASGGKC